PARLQVAEAGLGAHPRRGLGRVGGTCRDGLPADTARELVSREGRAGRLHVRLHRALPDAGALSGRPLARDAVGAWWYRPHRQRGGLPGAASPSRARAPRTGAAAVGREGKMEPSWEEAVRRGDIGAVRDQLARGANANARDRHGQTALMLAAHGGHLAVVQALLAHGVDNDVTAKHGLSALMLAVVAGHADIARLIARAGA